MNEKTEKRDLGAVCSFIRDVAEGDEHVLEITQQMLDPNGNDDGQPKKVTFQMQKRKLQPEPSPLPRRQESPPRGHVFYDTEGFCAYVQKYGGENTVIMADCGQPGHRRNVLDEIEDYDGKAICRARL